MGKVKIDLERGQVIQLGGAQSVDPRLRYLLRRDYANKHRLIDVLQVPEVKDQLLKVTLAGATVDAKVLHGAIKPVYEACAADKAGAAAKGYPLYSIGNCYRKLDAIVNPNNVDFDGQVVEVGKVVSAGPIGATHQKFSPVSKKAAHRKVAVTKARGAKIK